MKLPPPQKAQQLKPDEKSTTIPPDQLVKTKRGNMNRIIKGQSHKYYTDEEKKAVVSHALMVKLETPNRSIESIAREVNINRETIRLWLQESDKYQKYLQEQKALFDIRSLEVVKAGVKRMGEKIITANLPHATLAVGVLYDKIFGTQPIAEINVGDNRQVSVYYPNFKPPTTPEKPQEIEKAK